MLLFLYPKNKAAAAKTKNGMKTPKKNWDRVLVVIQMLWWLKEGEWNNKYDKSPEQIHSDVGESLLTK